MSQENVERLRWLYGEWDKGNLWAFGDITDPNVEWEWSEGLASVSGGPRVYHGLDEIAAATREWLTAWDHYWMTAEDFIDAADEVVVFMGVHAGQRAPTSCLSSAWQRCGLFATGRAVRVRYYDDRTDALEAVGLQE
jgi:ketosteroid isomerase-like protein